MNKNPLALFVLAGFIFMGCAAKTIIPVTEEGLIAEFTENSDVASVKYKNRVLQIRGVVTFIHRPKSVREWGFINLGDDGVSRKNNKVIVACFFKEPYYAMLDPTYVANHIPDNLRIGDAVIVQGNFIKYHEPDGWKMIAVQYSKVLEVIPQSETEGTDAKV